MSAATIPLAILHRLNNQIDDFLPRWTTNMDDAGYLESTTAKREDCILSYRWFLEPLIKTAEQGHLSSFGELIANTGNWAEKIIQTARRHRSRGITGEMFIGCFKTLVHAVLEMVNEGDEPLEQKMEASQFIRLWADALETIIVRDWTTLSQQEANHSLDHANRRLTMEKCKYENVIDSISDLVLVIDVKGFVLEANQSARQYFQKDSTGVSVLKLLGLKEHSLMDIVTADTANAPLEILVGDTLYFHCVFVPLNQVSLAADGYLAILKDVTAHVKQNEILETLVAKRTSDLLKKKSQLEEMNITLRTVMKSVDKEREAFQKRVGDIIRTTLLPALDPVRKELSESIRNSYLDIIEDQLLKLVRGGEHDSHAMLLKLTPMEMKVCRFIQAGASTKEIAEAFNLSTVTIQTHRRNIRHKLNLQNRNVNLTTFLNQSRQSELEEPGSTSD
jgi:DNA-binding NarL/FixJ family response regulator